MQAPAASGAKCGVGVTKTVSSATSLTTVDVALDTGADQAKITIAYVAWRGVAWRGVAWRGVACRAVLCRAHAYMHTPAHMVAVGYALL